MSSFANRMVRAAKLDVNLYEEVEADKQAMGQAMGVVVLASLAAGIGSVGTTGIRGLLLGTVAALAGWFIWALITFLWGLNYYRNPRPRPTTGSFYERPVFQVRRVCSVYWGLFPCWESSSLLYVESGCWLP